MDTAAEPAPNGAPVAPVDLPPAPPRMSITAGEGGLGVMFAALAKAQLNFKPVKADVNVTVQTREKGTYNFSYAPLENVLAACVPALNAEGFFFSQPLYSAADGEGYVLRTCLMHASGGMIEVQTYIPRPEGRIQDLGSAITYQRRYVAQALFGVNSEEDDDGAQASGDKATRQAPRAPQPSAAPPPARPAGPPKLTTVSAQPETPPPAQQPAPANQSAAEQPPQMTPEQSEEIADLFKKHGIKRPAAAEMVLKVTGKKGPFEMTTADAVKLIDHLKGLADAPAGAAS